MLKFEEGSQKNNVSPQAQRHPCAGCGADMVFEPAASRLVCPYCGRTEEIAAAPAEAIVERPYDVYLQPAPDRMRRLSEAALQVSCTGCGSVVTFEPPDVAGTCPFCGAKIVAQPKAADPLVAPEGVLPFAVGQKDATTHVRKWLATRWFAPRALKDQARQDAISGVYLPFWTYDAQTTSDYRGQRGEHYWETEHTTTTENGKTVHKSRQVRKTRWYSASGTVSRFFDDVIVAATRSLPRPRLDALEPWHLDALKPYDPAYLSGFKAQRYQVDLAEGFAEAQKAMAPVIEGDVRADIGGDEQRIHNVATTYSDVRFKHLLLPIWISAYRYDRKVYQVMVNARTGEVQGDRPYSIWKILGVALLVLAIVAGIAVFSRGGASMGTGTYSSPALQYETEAAPVEKPDVREKPAPPGPGRAQPKGN